MNRLQEILGEIGIEPARAQMINVSAAMAGEFVTKAEEISKEIKNLGPNPLRTSP